MKSHLRFSLPLFLLPLCASAQFRLPPKGFEAAPVLNASEILRPEFASGPGFKVREPVPTLGGRDGYMLDTDFGVFEADGNAMLVRRVREVAAIAQLREVSRGDQYKAALVEAAKSPIAAAKGLIENPVGTVTGVPKGIWKMLNRAGQGVKEAAQKRERSEYEDSNTQEMLGFSKAKRALAHDLGVDPYSSNEVLQRELNSVSWAAFAGKMTFSLATAPVTGGAGLALTASGVVNTFDQAIQDQSPSDLRMANQKRLLAMGCSRAAAEAFLGNTAFSPSTQTALVLHLDALKGVANRAALVTLAAGQAASEGDAIFFTQTTRLLAELHLGGRTLARLETLGSIPVAIGADGQLIVAVEWDYAAWTENAADFVAQLKAAKFGKKPPTGYVIALTGDASPMAKENLQTQGIQLATRLAPGPLK